MTDGPVLIPVENLRMENNIIESEEIETFSVVHSIFKAINVHLQTRVYEEFEVTDEEDDVMCRVEL